MYSIDDYGGRLRSNRKTLCAQRPKACGMLGYSDTTPNVTSRTSEGKSVMLRILPIKSSVSLINEGIVGMYGRRKKSTISYIPSVAEPHAETTGLPGTPFYVPLEAGRNEPDKCVYEWQTVEYHQ